MQYKPRMKTSTSTPMPLQLRGLGLGLIGWIERRGEPEDEVEFWMPVSPGQTRHILGAIGADGNCRSPAKALGRYLSWLRWLPTRFTVRHPILYKRHLKHIEGIQAEVSKGKAKIKMTDCLVS